MPESFAWPEGTISVYTGAAVPIVSALVAYAQNLNGSFVHGWDNRVTLSGVYYDHLTGQRVDVSIGAAFTQSMLLARIKDSATAVHMKLNHSGVNGSAGYFLYSGRFDSLVLNGSENGLMSLNLTYHANSWSAYG